MSNGVDEWVYSSDALNVLDRFHDAKAVVYVEGQEDIAFWSSWSDTSYISGYHIDYAGGVRELDKIASQILQDDAQVIVACDAHYSVLLGTLPNHDRIIASYGYSIENTMYCPHTISRVIRKLAYDLEDRTKVISEWYGTFCANAKQLLLYDLAREKYAKPVEVCGDRCSRFLKSRHSHDLDDTKIKDHIAQIKGHFRSYEIRASRRLIDHSSSHPRYLVSGHFLTNAIINLIKASVKGATGKRPVVPVTSLYALTSDSCRLCTDECDECVTYVNRVSKACKSLQIN